jgi:hypothetical protein
MSRVSEELYDGNVAKPASAGVAASNAAAIRDLIDALRATGVLKDDDSVTDAA